MAETLDIELAPISDEAFCGPDLDFEGDMAFMNFTAATEGQLPTDSYFDFDRAVVDFRGALATAAELKKRTHDLRLILLTAKLSILNRDFYSFARDVAEATWLLQNHWDAVHPAAEGGEFFSRLAQLESLNDTPIIVIPLQYATLLKSEREELCYRAVMVVNGEVKAREGEKLPSATVIERMLTTSVEVEAMARLYATMTRLRDDLDAISTITAEQVGHERAVKFGALRPLVGKIVDWVQVALARRDPSLAPAPTDEASQAIAAGGGGDAGPLGPLTFASLSDVDAALASALGYFLSKEPSSPAVLMIVQARATLGRNLFDVIRQLAPRHADSARLFVGPGGVFAIPVSNLSDAPTFDFSPGEAEPAASRTAAFGILEQVATHMRQVEPSSPAPYLLDRARTLAARDFLSLLNEVFEEDEIEELKKGR
jgi:type VI secretion system protein ImpA